MKSLSRRNFLKTSAILSGTALSSSLLPKFAHAGIMDGDPDIITIPSADPMENIGRLLEPLGGIKNFVKPGQSVG